MEKIKYINKIINPLGYLFDKYTISSTNELRLKKLLEHNEIKLVIDVGANRGNYGKMLREIGYKYKMISFEPLSSAHNVLSKVSVKDNNWIVAPRMAIGNITGNIEINISENIYSSSILNILDEHLNSAPKSKYISKEKTEIKILDSLIGNILPIDLENGFIKIDVQGYESQVIEGAEKVLSSIKGLQIELSLVPLYNGQVLFRDVIEILYDKGFELNAIFPGFSNQKTGKMLQMDGIFFRNG